MNVHQSYPSNSTEAPPQMGALDHAREASLSINSLEKTIDQLCERLGAATVSEVSSIGEASSEPSTGTELCDAICGNDRRVQAANDRLARLIDRLRV